MPARLYHEQIAHSDHAPARWLMFTHGIFGTGANWRGIARKVNAQRPEWGLVLVDLRLHGRSEDGAPPHTIAACADDVAALARELGGSVGKIEALAGHSLGGKVMAAARSRLEIEQTWLFDSTPSARPGAAEDPDNSVPRVLADLEALPRTWAKRDELVAALVARGHASSLAQWLAMSAQPDASGALALRFDLAALRALLDDYYRVDLWNDLDDPGGGRVDLVVADRSRTFSDDDRLRLGRAPAHVHGHHVDAGHWLHIDAPAAVVELLARDLV